MRPIAVRVVEYSYNELRDLRLEVMPVLSSCADCVGIDLDEYRNRITIFLDTGREEAAIRDRIRALGLPERAFRFERTGHPMLERVETLESASSPVRAGHRVYAGYDYGGRQACSIGFNAQLQGEMVFVTASHCTQSFMGMDFQDATQPFSGARFVGNEFSDPHWYECGWWIFDDECRLTDASAIRYSLPADSVDLGHIARPLPWSIDIDLQNPYFEVIGKWSSTYPPFGTPVNMVGFKSGWTTGAIVVTCAKQGFTRPGDGVSRDVECVSKAGYASQGGDSGAPVFTMHNDGVALAGIHTGAGGWFSAYGAIEAELGSMWVFEPIGGGAITVDIVGPPQSPPYPTEACEWTAVVGGASGSVSFEWKLDGQLVSWDPVFFPIDPFSVGQHWLEVAVTDASSSASDGVQVDVAYGYSCA